MKLRTFGWCLLALAPLAAGCVVHPVDPPPVTLQQYQESKGKSLHPYPARTIVLHNLRRALDTSLEESARVESLRLVTALGQDEPEVRGQLAQLLGDPGSSEKLRQAVLEILLAGGDASLAPYVVRVLPTLEPNSPTKDRILAWLSRNPSPGVLAEIVRLWAQEKSTTSLSEPRYREVVEALTRRKWDEALAEALNTESFDAKDAAMGILAARLTKERMAQTIAAVQPKTDVVVAIQAFRKQFDYVPAGRESVATCLWLYRNRQPTMADAARLYADWKQNYGYTFELGDFHLLSRLGRDPLRRDLRRTHLILELATSLLKRPHVPAALGKGASPYDFSDRFSRYVESLTMADLWRLLLLNEMLTQPRVQAALRVMAAGDRANTRTAWGGLIFHEAGQAVAKLYPSSYEAGTTDLFYAPGPQAVEDGRDALCRFQGHFEKVANADRAGPTAEELQAARQGGYCGLVLTSLDAESFGAHYYTPQGVIISLGKFPFR